MERRSVLGILLRIKANVAARLAFVALIIFACAIFNVSCQASVHKIIFDTDPGTDDAMALMLALNSPELDVRAITVVPGNDCRAGFRECVAHGFAG